MIRLKKPLQLRKPPADGGGIALTDYLFFVLVLTVVVKRYIGIRQGSEYGKVLFFVILVLLIAY